MLTTDSDLDAGDEAAFVPEGAEDSRRHQLIEATIETMADLGYAATTLAHIARRAGVSPGLVAHYFGDKDGLLEATLRSLASRLGRAAARRLAAAKTPRERLVAIVDANLAPEEMDHRTASVWLAFWGQAIHSERLRRIQNVYVRRGLSNLRYALKGLLPPDKAAPLAEAIAGIIDGLWLRSTLAVVGDQSGQLSRETAMRFIDSQLALHAASSVSSSSSRTIPAMTTPPLVRNYIGGTFVSTASGETFETINPATGRVIARVEIAGPAEIEAAVASAKAGQKLWAAKTGSERGRILRRVADILRSRNDELALLEMQDTGKPIQETSVVDVVSGAECLEYFAGQAGSLSGEHVDLGPSAFGYTRREPLGVVAGIGAWNYPLQIACWKSAPALACGNAMIFKPAELTPLTAVKLAEIMTEAGVPEGVFNVVQGFAPTGRLLTAHPTIRKISITGEVGTGKAVMADAAKTLKNVTLELGGKSPLVIFEDADLDSAVGGALLANFYSAGEVCSNGTRVFVHKSIKAAFLEKLVARVNAMIPGSPADPRTQIGALISEAHMNKVLDYIEKGKAEGAKALTGGHRLTEGALAEGFFVAPTVFDGCSDEMAIVREEIFGPVMCVLDFESEDEVVARANGTDFGLAAGVFTRDLTRGHRVVAALEAGTCWINHYNVTPIELPFGGVKLSGLGRENGRAAIAHYSQEKSVYVALKPVDAPY